MKSLLLPALFFATALAAHAANPGSATVSIAGTWKIHSEVAGNEYDSKCTLTQTDNVIGGTCTTAEGKDVKATGKVDGSDFTWSYDSEYNGTPMTITYKTTVSAQTDKLSGTLTVDPFNAEGDFTAVAEK